METTKIDWPLPDGSRTTFELYPIRTQFKAVGGVYIFCKYTGAMWSAIYVGETGNLNERLNTRLENHQAWPCAHAAGATHYCVQVVGHSQSRLNLETSLRHNLNPPCNRQ